MNCPRCEELVDDGAAFCGNCGLDVRELNRPIREDAVEDLPVVIAGRQSLVSGTELPAGPTQADIPRYAAGNPLQAKFEGKAMAALIISVLAVPAALVPFLGGVLGMIGLVLATSSRSLMTHKTLGNLAIGFSCLAFVLSLAAFSYNADQISKAQTAQSAATGADSEVTALADNTATAGQPATINGGHVDNGCYSLDVPELTHIESTASSCGLRAYNADTMVASSRALTVDTARQTDLTATNFPTVAQRLVGDYSQLILPGFTLSSQRQSTFAGSPAYLVDAKNGLTSVQMALVYRRTPTGDNLFIVVYGSDVASADLKPFEAAWIWK